MVAVVPWEWVLKVIPGPRSLPYRSLLTVSHKVSSLFLHVLKHMGPTNHESLKSLFPHVFKTFTPGHDDAKVTNTAGNPKITYTVESSQGMNYPS
jgi:hypothetical protein